MLTLDSVIDFNSNFDSLSRKFQQRLPYDLLTSLASALLDGTAFQIVKGLEEVQHLEEKSLFTQRLKMSNDHKCEYCFLFVVSIIQGDVIYGTRSFQPKYHIPR